MRKINVPFRGMTNVPDDNFSQDGDMAVLMNMRHKGGELVQCQPPTEKVLGTSYTFPKMLQAEYHNGSGYLIRLTSGKKLLYNSDKQNDIDIATGVESFSIMGNVIVMYTDKGVRYAIWRNDSFVFLGKLPELPELAISVKPVHVTTLSSAQYYRNDAELSTENEKLRWKNASKGYFDECLNGLYLQGAFIDRTLIRMAVRLFDGSYICYSPIYYVEDTDTLIENIGYYWLGKKYSIGRDNKNFFSVARSTTGATTSQYFTSVRGFVPYFKLNNVDLEAWRDIIVAIELFATPSIMGHESRNGNLSQQSAYLDTGSSMGQALVNLTTINNYDRYEWKGAKKIREEVAEASLFYKIAEFDLKGNEVWRLDETSPSQLAVQTQLPYNSQSNGFYATASRHVHSR